MTEGSPWTDLSRPPLRQAALRAALTGGPAPVWRSVEVVAATGSTNADVAARAAAGEPEGLVLVADHQRAGRGRLDRTWTAPPRAAIAVSVLLRPADREPDPDGARGVDPARWGWLPLLAGLAAVDALTRTCGLQARLKWPNDVLVPVAEHGAEQGRGAGAGGGAVPRKVCGILAEAVHEGGPAVVLGAGINVSQRPEELPVDTATSLALAGSATTDRDTVLRAYLRALAVRYRAWRDAAGDPRRSGVGPAYREACATLGLDVRVHLPGAGTLAGVAEEVDDAGRLVLRDPDGRHHALAAGDVVHVRPATS